MEFVSTGVSDDFAFTPPDRLCIAGHTGDAGGEGCVMVSTGVSDDFASTPLEYSCEKDVYLKLAESINAAGQSGGKELPVLITVAPNVSRSSGRDKARV